MAEQLTGPRVLAVLSREGNLDGCHAWRVKQPMAALKARGYDAGWDLSENQELVKSQRYIHTTVQLDLGGLGLASGPVVLFDASWAHWAEAVVIPRQAWWKKDRANGRKWIDSVHKAGKPVIYECDDDLMSEDLWRREVQLHGQTPEQATEIVESHRWALAQCDGATVTGQELANRVREYMPDRPIVVVPNAIDLEWFRRLHAVTGRRLPVNQLSIGWFGGIREDSDVAAMAEAWGRIARRFRHIKFIVYGHKAGIIWEHVPAERIICIPWVPVELYPAYLLNIDIGCASVADTVFNRCKSPIKAMEYAVSGACVAASPTLYSELIDDGLHGFICETVAEWERALAAYVEDPGLRRRTQRRLLHRVEKRYSLAGNLWRWPAAWKQIVEDFRVRRVRESLLAVPAFRAPVLVGAGGGL